MVLKRGSVMRELAVTKTLLATVKAELATVKAGMAAQKKDTDRMAKFNLAQWNSLMDAIFGEEWHPVRSMAAFYDQKKRLRAVHLAKEALKAEARAAAVAAAEEADAVMAAAAAAAVADEADDRISRAATPGL